MSHSGSVRRPWKRLSVGLLAAVLVLPFGAAVVPAVPAVAHEGEPFEVLVFSSTAGFRHGSIPDGIAAIQALAGGHNFEVDTTEDAADFTDGNLAGYEVVVWLNTTGDVLDGAQQGAFERYIQAGGGYVGVHSASDTEYDWPWYGELVGAYFNDHPANQTATIKVEDPAHPSTAHLGPRWERFDEWYNFQTNPRGDVHVLLSLDESSYDPGPGAMGAEHPIAWCHDYDGGRAWYTGLGHTVESYSEPAFLEHLAGGIETAAGVVDADCGASLTGSFEKVALDESTSNPMKLQVAADGRVFYIDRNGALRIIRPDGSTATAGTVDVYTGQEFGLLGLALDPDFASNGWVYLYYSPAGGDPVDRLSRFTMSGDSLDVGSEVVLLEVDTQRQECCHAGGALVFDMGGNLYLATGDNTNPFASDGFTPIDERPGRAFWDAQRTAANSNSLMGKVLRITPQADGSYTVPAGNLFTAGTPDTRPEIFAMGFRNPFTIGIDPQTDKLLVADYGPDVGSSDPSRGPDGRVEWNIVDEAGFYGWPYCVGANTPYIDYNFATGESGQPFNCDSPVNDSPNNTGVTQLPAAVGAELWMGMSSTGVPEIGQSGAPTASGAYRFDPDLASDRKWPGYWDGKAILGDWNNGRLFSIQPDESASEVVDVNRIFPELSFLRPHAFAWGPDGALYVIDWGTGFGGNNTDSGVYRIDYLGGTRDPIAQVTTDRTSGPVPLSVQFSAAGSSDPEGMPLSYAWDFDGDGTTDATGPEASHTYTEAGTFLAALTVTTDDDRSAIADVEIVAGNTAPTITINAPVNGGLFDFGDQIRYEVTVTDPEDGQVDCADVITQPGLGHDEHAHGYEQYSGCEGIFPLPGDEGHIGADIFGVVTVTYTDQGGQGGAKPLTSQQVVVLHTKQKQAEFFSDHGRVPGGAGDDDPGVGVEPTTDDDGGQNIGFITDGDWFGFSPMNLTGIDAVQFRVASQTIGGSIEIHVDDPEGPLVGTATVEPTGGWQNWTTVTANLDGVPADGGSSLYFVTRRPSGSDDTSFLLNINWMRFLGVGVSENARPVIDASASPRSGLAPLNVDFTASATDPEGDEPITLEWSFGDGETADTGDISHTYQDPGTYTARVTATDARGAVASDSFQITVAAPPLVCQVVTSDDFDGPELDRGTWSTVVRENQDLRIEDGHLVIPTTNTDIYGTGNSDTPNIVLQPLPEGQFIATAKLTLEARRAYQQAGLVIYGDDDNYAKMVLQGRSTGADDAASRIFQFIREENGAPNEVADSNTGPLGAEYPDTVWVRFTSDGSNLQASYSADGVTFTDMPETKSLAGIEDPHIGLLSLSGGVESPVIDARFDSFDLATEDHSEVDPDDEFDGTELDGCRWNGIVRPDPATYRVADGALEIDTSFGDIYAGGNSDPENLILQPAPEGDWTIETKVDGSALNEQYQQGGLLVYVDDGNYVKFDYVVDNPPGATVTSRLELLSEIDDVVQQPQPGGTTLDQAIWYLRLTKQGDAYHGSYSADGETWTELPEPVSNAAAAAGGAKVGLFAIGGPQQASQTARFDYFRFTGPVEADTMPPATTATTTPAEPDGDNGWHVTPVTVTLSAVDDVSGVARTEYMRDTDWVEYAGPFPLDQDGVHSLVYRSVDEAGNVEASQALELQIDTTPPVVQIGGVQDGGEYGADELVAVSVSGDDATSGLASLELTLDGEPVEAPLAAALVGLSGGPHELAAVVTDVAGNTAETSVSFEVEVSFAAVTALVEGYIEAGRLHRGQWPQLLVHLAAAERLVDRDLAVPAGRALDRFVRVADQVADEEARAVLLAAAEALRAEL